MMNRKSVLTQLSPQKAGCYIFRWLVFIISFHFAASAQPPANRLDSIPTKDQVGATRLRAEIAPITAPFPMPQLKKPAFPALTMSIIEKGAKQGETTTKQIQAAIDEVSKRKGGTVIIPKGTWLSG